MQPSVILADLLSMLIIATSHFIHHNAAAYNTITRKIRIPEVPEEWVSPTWRCFVKIAIFTFLFWALLRVLLPSSGK